MKKQIDTYDETPQEQDYIEKYAPHACCIAVLLSAGIMAGLIYFIYWIITKLI